MIISRLTHECNYIFSSDIVVSVTNVTTVVEGDNPVTVVITTSGGVSIVPITLTVTTSNGTAVDGEWLTGRIILRIAILVLYIL